MKAKIKREWYGRDKSAEELHDDSKNWLSEIDFVNDEMRFLEHLLASNYIDLLEADLEKEAKKIANDIDEERKIGSELQELIRQHENVLDDLIETNSVDANTHYKDIHKKLEYEILFFNKKYKKLKRKIFGIVENIMRKKNQKRIPKS